MLLDIFIKDNYSVYHSYSVPCSRFPIPVPLLGGVRGGFRFPIPDSLLPAPCSLFPIPDSRSPPGRG
ncbi:MAG: hypothetical protein F6J90_12275 [Moorea sp. SIOASIH]|uniref:hypothetical protein n=1 Tax=Moorena sp. SIOASIH TaxID=2607817 RepID=UPI0013B90F90|nr:hypothetical protein [Moorena sp. SIOASIH]NEO37042.1 hypothetical protein [Moorena sp. SIOASIH]